MCSCGLTLLVILGAALVLTPAHTHPQRGNRRKPGKYRNPEYEGGQEYSKPERYPNNPRPYQQFNSGAASAASAASSAGSLSGGGNNGHHGNSGALSQSQANSLSTSIGIGGNSGALSQSQAQTHSGALGLGSFGGSVSQSQASANSAAGSSYRPRPEYYPNKRRPRPGYQQNPDIERYEDY